MPAAFIVQFCCGSLYSWSVFNKPIDELIYGENRNMAPITFYIAVGALGLAAAIMGPWLERNGPLVTCALGTSLFYTGNLLTALALHFKLIWLVFLGYGVISGFGLGVCYISPVSALQKWFPDKRGLAAGLAVCGFGAGSIVISKVQLPLMHSVGLPLTFVILGSSYFTLMIVSACVLRTPPPNYTVLTEPAPPKPYLLDPNLTELKVSQGGGPAAHSPPSVVVVEEKRGGMTLIEAITSTDFRLLMIMFSANILFGLVLVSRLSNIITDVFGKTAEEASTVVSINGGFNLGGRLLLSVASDFIGRKNCFFLMLTFQVVILGCFSTMTVNDAYWPFVITMWIITGCYGSAFGVIPAFLSDKYGPANIGACHGIILTGWSFAGVGGGLIFTAVFNAVLATGYEATDPHPYNVNVWWIFGLVCIGWVALLFIRPTQQDQKFSRWVKGICGCARKNHFERKDSSTSGDP